MISWNWFVLPAIWIGWAVMVCAGALAAMALVHFTAFKIDQLWKGLVSLHYLREAVDEWKRNHPEKAAKYERMQDD